MSIQAAVGSRLSAGRQRAAELGRRNRAHVVGVGALATIIAAIYAAYALALYATDRDSSYDLVIFDQAIRSYAHFHLGISVIKGIHNGFGPNFSVLGDHFSPIDMALAPLYWIYDGPQTLLVAQPVLFALAIPWLWVFTRRAFGGAGWKATSAAYLACIAYGLSLSISNAVSFDYHEVAFAPVLTAIALERLQVGRLRSALIALGLLLLVKEDMGLLVAGIGLYLAVAPCPTVRRQRLVGAILVTVGVAYTGFATDVLIPAFGGRANYYWAYSNWGNNVPQVVLHILENPARFVRLMFSPQVKLHTLEWLFGVLCLLPLLSPVTLAALPLLVERMENSQFPAWWNTGAQYDAFLVVVLVVAAVDGAARLDRWATRLKRHLELRQTAPAAAAAADEPASDMPGPALALAGVATVAEARPAGRTNSGVSATARRYVDGVVALACCAALGLAAFVALPYLPLSAALSPGFYRQTPWTQAAAAAYRRVPSGVVVAAANDLGPKLSARDTVLLWDGDGYTPPFAAPWVLADLTQSELGFGSRADQRADVVLLEGHGYRVMFQRDGIIVLHRPGPAHLGITARKLDIVPRAPG